MIYEGRSVAFSSRTYSCAAVSWLRRQRCRSALEVEGSPAVPCPCSHGRIRAASGERNGPEPPEHVLPCPRPSPQAHGVVQVVRLTQHIFPVGGWSAADLSSPH